MPLERVYESFLGELALLISVEGAWMRFFMLEDAYMVLAPVVSFRNEYWRPLRG